MFSGNNYAVWEIYTYVRVSSTPFSLSGRVAIANRETLSVRDKGQIKDKVTERSRKNDRTGVTFMSPVNLHFQTNGSYDAAWEIRTDPEYTPFSGRVGNR